MKQKIKIIKLLKIVQSKNYFLKFCCFTFKIPLESVPRQKVLEVNNKFLKFQSLLKSCLTREQ